MSNALLLIDPQVDFCLPHGKLYVPGADQDMERLAEWIHTFGEKLDYIVVTLDSHVVNSVFHPNWFVDIAGNPPPPFTPIRLADLDSGAWTPRFYPEATRTYLQALENQGEFVHTIWPEHCLLGSDGHQMTPAIERAIFDWTRKTGKLYQPVIKGMHPQTEHYGVFVAQVPYQNQPTTELNQPLLQTLNRFDRVWVAGEAKSHCVATSIRQIVRFAPALARKLTLLTDCTSPVPGFENLADPIFDEARKAGMRESETKVNL